MRMRTARPGLLSIGTAVPTYQIDQTAVGACVADSLNASPPLRRWIKRLYELSGIETRYSCLPEAAKLNLDSPFAPGLALADSPTTAERMAIYQREAIDLGVAAAEQALAAPAIAGSTAQITHLIVVSCTGFFAPGLDLVLAERLGLGPTIQRTLVGFMGCAAAFNGLRLAAQIVAGQPEARVLVVCVELCTLHLQPGADRPTLTAASLFADGAAACLVGAPDIQGDVLLIDRFHSQVQPASQDAMAWQIGDHGFVMNLSSDVPRHIDSLAPSALANLLDGLPSPEFWAIHPGGRAIVDRLAELLALSPAQTAASYAVLRRYGNMSSATILFVLRELWASLRSAAQPASGVAVAFGPGLVTELAALTYLPPAALHLDQPQQQADLASPHYVA
jgi:predicted naringenin-chalcone synthase